MHSVVKFKFVAVLALALAGMAIVVGSAAAHRGHGDRQASLDSTTTDADSNGTIDGLEGTDCDGANNTAEPRLRTNCAVANKRFGLGEAEVKSYSAEDGLTLAIGK